MKMKRPSGEYELHLLEGGKFTIDDDPFVYWLPPLILQRFIDTYSV